MLLSLLPLRPGIVMVLVPGDCFGVGSILVRRVVIALDGLDSLRAIGLSSLVLFPSSSTDGPFRPAGLLMDNDEPGVV
jgi:hypothetical protein